jgi:CpeT/CpcT family (DUF1001)
MTHAAHPFVWSRCPLLARASFAAACITLAGLSGCVGSWGATAPGNAASFSIKSDKELAALAGMMTGAFSSEAQAAADADFFDIRLEIAPIWTDRTDAHWFYVEQAMAGRLSAPYRQRIYKLSRLGDARARTFQSEVFTLPEPALQFAGAARDPGKLAAVTPELLSLRTGCAVVLTADRLERNQALSYAGGTVGTGCASDLRGATYATSKVTLDASGMISWDQGFNAEGTQVWGAQKGGYQFVKVAR